MKSERFMAVLLGVAALLATASRARADNDPAARFRGAPTYDLAVTNVKWEAATEQHSYVMFDLSWSYSWRAAWVEDNSVTGAPLKVENWDAAWVFVKFLAEKDKKESIERNHWRHATLSHDASHHVMLVGATNTVGLADDGSKGIGVFIYRDAIGHGNNDFRGVKLRWLHATDKVDPRKAALAVHPIAMVYVPECPFKVGTGCKSKVAPFADGPTRPLVGMIREDFATEECGSFTDGSWRGGATVPFLVDSGWSGPVTEGTNARRVGLVAGQLWGTLVWDTHNRCPQLNTIGVPGALNDGFPTGYRAFYCMKYELTQGQYAAFINSLPPDVAAKRAFISGDGQSDAPPKIDKIEVNVGAGYRPHVIKEQDGHTIACSGDKIPKIPITPDAGKSKGLDVEGERDPTIDALVAEAMTDENKPKRPPVYTARMPHRACNYLSWLDGFAYAVWAGLRPMTELEYEKACRGPRQPIPCERAWGTTEGTKATGLLDAGLPTERFTQGNHASPFEGMRRVGIFATATSDRVASGGSYWGIMELGGNVAEYTVTPATAAGRAFRGTHGDGSVPTGKPDAEIQRGGTGYNANTAGFDTAPADWPPEQRSLREGTDGVGQRGYDHNPVSDRTRAVIPYHFRHQMSGWRAVRTATAGTQPTKASPKPAVAVARGDTLPPEPARTDTVKITNVRWEAGTEQHCHVTFDLSWENSWRAAWTEAAERNVTGAPLKTESWDAAWVFVKFRQPGANASVPATLSADAAHHTMPAGAASAVGRSDDGQKGVGLFVYKGAVGHGPNAFRNVKVRWLHGADKADPGKVSLSAHAIEMVYVPEGPFRSRSPFGRPSALINSRDPAPNGYGAFYCMKRSISQGQYAEFLNSVAADLPAASYNAERYKALPHDAAKRYSAKLHGLNGYTIRVVNGVYTADTPDRACNFLSWPDILSYAAWAGLRPITDLEYEKAYRGPREPAQGEDAWADAVCAPAESIGKTAAGHGSSYWGIRELSLSGNVHEWPGTVQTASKAGPGAGFKGTHGDGTPEAPSDWPSAAFGEGFWNGAWIGTGGISSIGIWVAVTEIDRLWGSTWWAVDSDRTGRFGARAVRTAP